MSDNFQEIEENSTNYSASKYRTPDGVPADVVIFTITSEEQNQSKKSLPKRDLKILMIKRKKWPYAGCWALPGGFSNENETIFDAANRELMEETGIDGIHIEQFGVYSTPGRDPRGWIISIAYYALVNERFLEKRKAADDAADVKLISVKELLQMQVGEPDGQIKNNEGKIAFDHIQIIKDALQEVQNDMRITGIAKEFLPEEFTIAELHQIVKTVLPKELVENEPSNFRRKILSIGLIEEVEGKTSIKYSQRPAKLYRFTEFVPKNSLYK